MHTVGVGVVAYTVADIAEQFVVEDVCTVVVVAVAAVVAVVAVAAADTDSADTDSADNTAEDTAADWVGTTSTQMLDFFSNIASS